jgi:[acyl-carrier-protein] S-malonyltransferase
MAALLGLDYETGIRVAQEASATSGEDEICEIANDNGGGQVVASGTKKAVDHAIEIAKGKGARRAMLLSVSAPFHCALMQPAAEAMAEALSAVDIAAPKVPVVANVTARPVTDAESIRRSLVAQVTGTVRWRESVAFMAGAGVDRFLELGSGKVLTGLLKRIADGATGLAIGTPADIAAYTARAA